MSEVARGPANYRYLVCLEKYSTEGTSRGSLRSRVFKSVPFEEIAKQHRPLIVLQYILYGEHTKSKIILTGCQAFTSADAEYLTFLPNLCT